MDILLQATHVAQRRHFWFRGFRSFVSPLIERGVAGAATPRILDAGCGTGANLDLLGRWGRVVGVDLNRTGLEFARHEGHPRLALATVARLPFVDGRFDLVASFDVFVTLPGADETEAAAEMLRVLRPGGALVVNVAAMDVLRGNHSVLSHEVRRYSAASLRALLERAGFEVVHIRYTNAVLFPIMLAVRAAQRAVGLAEERDATAEITVPPAPINALLSGLLRFEAAALGPLHLPFGSSLACLARKPRSLAATGGEG